MAKKVREIQDHDRVYSFLRHYVDFSLKLAYRRIRYVGREKLPAEGSVIYAPNHTNALMDALVILAIDHKEKVFVARADIFKNPKVAKILTFLKIMPIMRIRDGFDEVRKNDEIIRKSVAVLRDGVPFCILPEGRHQAKHTLLPLSKGIFRIALQAEEIFREDGHPLYIVPVGLEYGNFFRYRSTVLVTFGEPIDVRAYMDNHAELSQAELINAMKDTLTERMKQLIIYIPDDEYYEATRELCACVYGEQIDRMAADYRAARKAARKGEGETVKGSFRPRALQTRFAANRKILSEVERLRKEESETASKLLGLAAEIEQERLSNGISMGSVAVRRPFLTKLMNLLILLATLPYTLPVGLLTLPITALASWLFKLMKDRAFYNSIRFVLTLVMWPLLLIIYSVVLYCCLPWEWALGISLALVPGTVITQEAYRLARLGRSDLKLIFRPSLRRKIRDLNRLFFEACK